MSTTTTTNNNNPNEGPQTMTTHNNPTPTTTTPAALPVNPHNRTDTTTASDNDHKVATQIAEALQNEGFGKPSLHCYMMEIILSKMNPEQPRITQTICRRCKRPMTFTQTKESDGTYTPDAWGVCRGCKRSPAPVPNPEKK